MPVTRLKSVVLPAPFGPISPTISPASTSSDTSSTATMPPNRFVTFCTVSSAIAGDYPMASIRRLRESRNDCWALARGRDARARGLDAYGGRRGRGGRLRGRADRQVPRLTVRRGDRDVPLRGRPAGGHEGAGPRARRRRDRPRGDGLRDRRGAPARPRPQPPDARRLVAAPLRNRLVRWWHPERRVRGVDGPVAGRRRGLTLSLSCDREDWRVDAFGS